MSLTTKNIYVNLPVKDLRRSTEFFGQIGFQFDERYTDENATCMVMNDNIFAMLLREDFFQSFTKKEIPDPGRSAEVIVALTADSRARVDEIFNRALAAGATSAGDPIDHGFMYSRSFRDPDGHLWEFFYMDPDAEGQQ
jgi:predicted lactoylglutathione lyase